VASTSGDVRINAIEQHREEKHNEFLSPKSPLLPADKKKFKGLHYYPPDTAYIVRARFMKNEKPQLFKMKTTTSRLPEYQKYGDVVFSLLGNDYRLEVYQSVDLMKTTEYKDHLFIPFTDKTNGEETYEVGRYLELNIPASEDVVLDFNLCYNPYCAYGGAYSCPIPPEANALPIEVKAGEKKYKH
jgi:uncharacterized protein